ncbi:hypothetical protein AB0N31_10655 [Streptomyces sp. NPDC051051]|uniref:hypothetical protein n=1 Tax=Streptomyces sp. NPDC051051 TaxID=3155666 RepID=UPI0034334B63
MRIRMLVAMPEGAARNGEPWPAEGEEVDLPTAEAAHLVASGVAEEVAADAEPPAAPRRRRAAHPEGEAT